VLQNRCLNAYDLYHTRGPTAKEFNSTRSKKRPGYSGAIFIVPNNDTTKGLSLGSPGSGKQLRRSLIIKHLFYRCKSLWTSFLGPGLRFSRLRSFLCFQRHTTACLRLMLPNPQVRVTGKSFSLALSTTAKITTLCSWIPKISGISSLVIKCVVFFVFRRSSIMVDTRGILF